MKRRSEAAGSLRANGVINSSRCAGRDLVSGGPTVDANDAPTRSRGFFIDLLSDSNGVRFHRFQFCAWTVLLGLIFATTIYDDLVMPEFGDTLLALVGISAATDRCGTIPL